MSEKRGSTLLLYTIPYLSAITEFRFMLIDRNFEFVERFDVSGKIMMFSVP
jgi:hypothetical protein